MEYKPGDQGRSCAFQRQEQRRRRSVRLSEPKHQQNGTRDTASCYRPGEPRNIFAT